MLVEGCSADFVASYLRGCDLVMIFRHALLLWSQAAAPEGDAAPAAAAHPAAEATAAAAAHRDGGSVRLMDAELPSDDEEDSDFG